MKKLFIIALLAFTTLCAKELVFGVVPQQSPLKLIKKWQPVVNHLIKQSGLKIVFKTESSIPKFEEALYLGKYDIAYMNPYHFIEANKKQGYIAVARSSKLIQGILVAPKTIVDLDLYNLKNKNFLFPAPNAFAATLLTKYELKNKFDFDVDKEVNVLYVNSHDSVYKGVARGIGSIGGGIVRTFNNLKDDKTKEKIHIIYKTATYPSHPIGFKPTLTKLEQEILIKAFLQLPPELMKALNIPKIIKTTNQEYDEIKKLAIELNIY